MKLALCLDHDPLTRSSWVHGLALRLAEHMAQDHDVVIYHAGAPSEKPAEVPIVRVRDRSAFVATLKALGEEDRILTFGMHWASANVPDSTRAPRAIVPGGFRSLHAPVGAWRRAVLLKTAKRALRRKLVVVDNRLEGADVRALYPSARTTRLPTGIDPWAVQDAARLRREAWAGLPEGYAVLTGGAGAHQRVHLAKAACQALGIPLVIVGPGAGPYNDPAAGVFAIEPNAVGDHEAILAGARFLLQTNPHQAHAQSLLEALCLGVPFVSSLTGPGLELSAQTGCPLFAARHEPRDLEPFICAIQDLLATPSDAAALRGVAETHSWTRLLPAWKELLETGSNPWPSVSTGLPRIHRGAQPAHAVGYLLQAPGEAEA